MWTVLSISVAIVSTVQMQPLRRESDALLLRSRAHADAFASSFDGQFADQQLDTFQQRRDVVSRVQSWQRLQLLGALGTFAGLFAVWLLWMLGRLHADLAMAEPHSERDPRSPEQATGRGPRPPPDRSILPT
jgi:ferric-dicitrate binding protein FerR (iron transport regulator)